jgi:dipeptidyl aminopeptidase/acylaminoacyl peptidase
MRKLFLIVLVNWSAVWCVAGTTHPFSVQDMQAMDRISDPQVAPDGQWVAFVVRKTDLDANRGRTDLWLVRTDGTGLRQLTTDPEADANPRWGPDSRTLWFVSGRSGSAQVRRIRIDGGEAEQVTKEPLDVGNLIVARDGQHLAFTMDVFLDANGPEGTKKELDVIEHNKSSGRIFDRLYETPVAAPSQRQLLGQGAFGDVHPPALRLESYHRAYGEQPDRVRKSPDWSRADDREALRSPLLRRCRRAYDHGDLKARNVVLRSAERLCAASCRS